MPTRRRVIQGAAGLTASFVPFGAGRAEAEREPIPIGAIVSTTGSGAGTGLPQRNGILLAEKAVNRAGGVNGQPIRILVEDDSGNPDTAVTKANTLVHSERVKLVVGPSFAAATLAVGGVTDPLKVPVLPYTGIGLSQERDRRSVLHMLPSQELNAAALLYYAAKALSAKRAGVIHDSGYGNIMVASIRRLAPEYSIRIVAAERFEIGATDTTVQAAKVRAAAPEVIFIIASSATPFRNVRQLRLTVPILAALGTASYEHVRAMGEAGEGIVTPEFLVAEDPLPNQRQFVDLFRAEYGTLPKTFEACAWDSVHAGAAALRKVGPDADYASLSEALRGPYTGVTATYDFSAPDLTGLTLRSYVYSKVVDGHFERLPFKAGT